MNYGKPLSEFLEEVKFGGSVELYDSNNVTIPYFHKKYLLDELIEYVEYDDISDTWHVVLDC